MMALPITLPVPQPIPIPWPSPSPGVGSPFPSPGGSSAIPFPMPLPSNGSNPALTGNGLSNLFKFPLDWRYLGALLFLGITVWIVEENWPEWAFGYAALLLLGVTVVTPNFGTQLNRLIGR